MLATVSMLAQAEYPGGRYQHQMVNIGDKIYLFGGISDPEPVEADDALKSVSMGGEAKNDLWVFANGFWKLIIQNSLNPLACRRHAMTVIGLLAYSIGGDDFYNTYHSGINTLNSADEQWFQEQFTGNFPAISGHAATSSGSEIFVFGGTEKIDNSTYNSNDKVYKINTETKQISSETPKNQPSGNREVGTVTVGGKVYSVYGRYNDGSSSDKIKQYDNINKQWDDVQVNSPAVNNPPAGSEYKVAKLDENRFFMSGGKSSTQTFNNLFLFDAIASTFSKIDVPDEVFLYGAEMTTIGSTAFFYGGFNNGYLDNFYKYDHGTGHWFYYDNISKQWKRIGVNYYNLHNSVSPPEAAIEGCTATPSGTTSHEEGEVVQLMANDFLGWEFVSWTGAISSSTPSATVTMDEDKNVTANFKRVYYLTVGINPDAAATGFCSATPLGDSQHDEGEVVALSAIPAVGWRFDSWIGPVASQEPTTTITMDSDKEVMAVFQKVYNLTVNIFPADAVEGPCSASPAGTTWHDEGAVVNLGAAIAQGWRFESWTGDVSSSALNATVIMDADKTVTANFVKVFNLEVNVLPADALSGSCTVSPSGNTEHDEGEVVNLSSTTAEGWRFESWSGDVSSTALNATVTMDADKSVIANFIRTYSLVVSIVPAQAVSDGCTVSQSGSGTYDEGESVTLIASPAGSWGFVRWNGSVSSPENPVTLLMDADKEITCSFEQETGFTNLNTGTEGLKLYPNPVTDKVILSLQEKNSAVRLKIFDVAGNVVYEEFEFRDNELNLSSLKNGIYFIKCENDNKIFTAVFMKN
ncbi:MAG: T9SS type A sorting domain-containing protein [Prolixibacteraceae bacterium]|nr:T9SS type A sorting domain-containing protein [Prolixibacteraceae bacterium]